MRLLCSIAISWRQLITLLKTFVTQISLLGALPLSLVVTFNKFFLSSLKVHMCKLLGLAYRGLCCGGLSHGIVKFPLLKRQNCYVKTGFGKAEPLWAHPK